MLYEEEVRAQMCSEELEAFGFEFKLRDMRRESPQSLPYEKSDTCEQAHVTDFLDTLEPRLAAVILVTHSADVAAICVDTTW